jgi:SAM-dependent methyltransferase
LEDAVTEERYEPRSYWDVVADEIEQRGGMVAGDDTPFHQYKREKFLRNFLGSMPIEGQAVLEFGCGPGGNLTECMKRQPRRLVGCDVSPAMARIARRTGTQIVELHGTRLPFADQEFDLVFTATVLQHNSEMDQLISEICRVSAQTVQIIEDVGPLQGGGSYFRRPVDHYADACRSYGFRLVSADALSTWVSGRLHYALMRALDRRERHEGEPVPSAVRALEKLFLPMASRLDERSDRKVGLTRMSFQRL